VAATSIALFGTNILFAAKALREVANDPIDQNYSEIPEPVVIELPEVVADDGIDEIQATILNEWLSNLAKGASLARAFVSGINRAQGADAAGDSEARERQLTASRDFAGQWADNLVEAADLRLQVAVAISNFKLDEISIPQSDVWEIQSEILVSGWPEEVIDTLPARIRNGTLSLSRAVTAIALPDGVALSCRRRGARNQRLVIITRIKELALFAFTVGILC
jgi:hypothetical protein